MISCLTLNRDGGFGDAARGTHSTPQYHPGLQSTRRSIGENKTAVQEPGGHRAGPGGSTWRHFILPLWGNVFGQKRDWMGSPSSSMTEGDVECFSEYMELWIHRLRIEGLRLWLSGILRIQVGLVSMENLNHQLSSCGFALHRDLDKNYVFRVMYSGCFVQLEHGNYVIVLNLLKRVSRFGGRTQKFMMKCPAVLAPPNREYIQCDSDFIQVTREIPVDNWNNELDWSLALRGSLVVALEDSSLIQVNVEMHKPNITVQGRRDTILSPVQVFASEGHFLPLKLVSGNYAYSMEATCPNGNTSSSNETVLHIYKRRMGLTKRGGYQNETLSVSSVMVEQTDTFTWTETTDFVQLSIPTSHIQQNKECLSQTGEKLQQNFYKIDAVLTFKETNHKMHWTMENTSPCSDMLKSHSVYDDPQEANFTTHSPTWTTDRPEIPDDYTTNFTPSVPSSTTPTALQTADPDTSTITVPTPQPQTTEVFNSSTPLSPQEVFASTLYSPNHNSTSSSVHQ